MEESCFILVILLVCIGIYGCHAINGQSLNKSYTEEELEDLLASQLSESLESSFSEHDFQGSLWSMSSECMDCSFDEDQAQADVQNLMMSTPSKDSSYTEEDWKSFLAEQSMSDSSGFDDAIEDYSELSFGMTDSDHNDLDIADPEFFTEVHPRLNPRAASNRHSPSPSRESSLMKKALEKGNILKCVKKKCKCGQRCHQLVSAKETFHIRERFWTKSRQCRSQYLIHNVGQRDVCGRFTYLHLDNGIKVCRSAFIDILKIDKKALLFSQKLRDRGAKATPDKIPRSVSCQTITTINWLKNYAMERGDRMPHSADILLPYKTTKTAVYQTYNLVFGKSSCSQSQFFRLWKDHFPHLKIKETNSFSMCSKCAGIEKKLEQTLSRTVRDQLLKQRDEHLKRQMNERLYYYSKREKSRANPEKYLSMIIDGMDQAKSNLPHFTGRQSKSINPADLLKTHITGVINHGQRRFNTFVDYNQWPHDPNLTINILLLALQKSIMTVHLSFLFVGHTHEDVDAGFSTISKKLRQQDVETYTDLIELLPNSEEVSAMFDVKSWLEPYLCTPQQHTQPHHFRFALDNDDILIQYKGLFDQKWFDLKMSFFKLNENGQKHMPCGTPKVLKPNYEKIDTDRLDKQINAISHLFSTQDNVIWWKTFLQKLKQQDNTNKQRWILKTLPRQKKDTAPENSNGAIPHQLQKLLDKELETPEVKIVKSSTVVQRQQRKNISSESSKKKRRIKNQGGRRHKTIAQTRVTRFIVLFNMDGPKKRHIWFLILSVLLESLILCVFMVHLCICVDIILLLISFRDILNIIFLIMKLLWKEILWTHIGFYAARATLLNLQEHCDIAAKGICYTLGTESRSTGISF